VNLPNPFRNWLTRRFEPTPTLPIRRKPVRNAVRGLEQLESRDTPTGTFAAVANAFPDSHGVAMMEPMPDGTVLVQVGPSAPPPGGVFATPSNQFYILTPDATGSYTASNIHAWTSLTSTMPVNVDNYVAALLPGGNILFVGGGSNTAEIYNVASQTFTSAASPPAGVDVSADTPIELLPNGNVLVADRNSNSVYVYQFNSSGGVWSQTGS
jgi:hypothetical protein